MTTTTLLAADPTPQEAEEAPPDEAEDEGFEEETIEIRHGEDGTEVIIEDPTLLEIGALIVIALVVITAVHAIWTRGRNRNYRL